MEELWLIKRILDDQEMRLQKIEDLLNIHNKSLKSTFYILKDDELSFQGLNKSFSNILNRVNILEYNSIKVLNNNVNIVMEEENLENP